MAAKLARYKDKPLPNLWFIHGNEQLLSLESQDLLRKEAKDRGFSERKSFVIDANGDYSAFYEALGDRSLFGEKTLLEVIIPKMRIGTKGPVAIQALIDNLDESIFAVVTLIEEDWTVKSKNWYKALTARAEIVDSQPVTKEQLPAWITQRAMLRHNQKYSPEAAKFLAEKTEGNLLACSQEIEKLALLCPNPNVEVDDILSSVSDVSRFDVESLEIAILSGDSARIVKIIDSLRAENVAIPAFLWILIDDVRKLINMSLGNMPNRFTLGAKAPLMSTCIKRFPLRRFELMLHRLAEVDKLSKGLRVQTSDMDAWSELKAACLLLAVKRK